MNDILTNVEFCSLFTGTNGRRGCTGNCAGCFTGKIAYNHNKYQGHVDQVHELLSILPNLKRVLIFGNPDPTVDPEFCNATAKILQSKGIEVLFTTNGTGTIETVKRIIEGLDLSLVSTFSFSVDSLDEKMNAKIKRTFVSLQNIFESMNYLLNLNICVQTLFTVWPTNQDEDWKAYVDFFESRGVCVGHGVGCIQTAEEKIAHVSEKKLLEMREKYSEVGLATILATDEEYEEYLLTYVHGNRLKCTNYKNLTVYFTEKEIKATYLCTILSSIYPEYLMNISDLAPHKFYENTRKTGICPVAKEAMGFESVNLKPVCRHYVQKPREFVTVQSVLSF